MTVEKPPGKPPGRPKKLVSCYPEQYSIPMVWKPIFDQLIEAGEAASKAELVRKALMLVFPGLPSPYRDSDEEP